MTEINVSPKTPINQFKLHVGLNDGHKLAEDLQGLQLGVQHTDRQTDSSVPQSRLPMFKLLQAFMGLHIFFFRLVHRGTQKTKSTPPKWQSNGICYYCEQTYIYSYSVIHNTIKTSQVTSSGLFTGHHQNYIIRTCERNCTIVYDVTQTVQSSTMWKKLYNRLRCGRNCAITYDVEDTVQISMMWKKLYNRYHVKKLYNRLWCETNCTIIYDLKETVQSSTMWKKLYNHLRCGRHCTNIYDVKENVQSSTMWKKLHNRL